MTVRSDDTPKFTSYNDPLNYNGCHPSGKICTFFRIKSQNLTKATFLGKYIKTVLSKWIELKRHYMDFEMQRRSGRIMVIDHTFKVLTFYL